MATENISRLNQIYWDLVTFLGNLEDRLTNEGYLKVEWSSPNIRPDNQYFENPVVIENIKTWLLDLENNIERRYLKSPLVKSWIEVTLFESLNSDPESEIDEQIKTVIKGLNVNADQENDVLRDRKDLVKNSTSPRKLCTAVHILDSNIDWEKSSRKRRCSFNLCTTNGDVGLEACGACRRCYHPSCIARTHNTTRDLWICARCLNKSTGSRNCLLCGEERLAHNILLICERCEVTYHSHCIANKGRQIFFSRVHARTRFMLFKIRESGILKRFFNHCPVFSRIFRKIFSAIPTFLSIDEKNWFCQEHRRR